MPGQIVGALVEQLAKIIALARLESSCTAGIVYVYGRCIAEGWLPRKDFEDMDIYRRCHHRISAVVQIPDWTYSDQATFGEDVQLMMKKGLTFDEVRQSPEFALMAKSRLARVRADLFAKLEAVI